MIATPLPPGVRKEARALLPLWALSVAALVAALQWPSVLSLSTGLAAYLLGSTALGAHAIGHEYAHRTMPMLLAQPADRRRVLGWKLGVLAVLLLTIAPLAWYVLRDSAVRWTSVPSGDGWPIADPTWRAAAVLALPVAIGGMVAPWLTMVCRGALAGMLFSAAAAGCVWQAIVLVVWLGPGAPDGHLDRVALNYLPTVLIPLCFVSAALGWRRFMHLEAIDGSPSLFNRHWLRPAEGTREHRPIAALVVKELHLQQMTFVLMAFHVVGLSVSSFAGRLVPPWVFPFAAVNVIYGLILAIVAGALASAEERAHGVVEWHWQHPAAAWRQWIVKVAVLAVVALSCGVALSRVLDLVLLQSAFRTPVWTMAIAVTVLAVGSLYVSSIARSGVHAMVLCLPFGMGAAVFLRWASDLAEWIAPRGEVAGPTAALGNWFSGTPLAYATAVALMGTLLWFSFVNHTASDRPPRRIAGQVAAVAALAVAAVLVLQLAMAV